MSIDIRQYFKPVLGSRPRKVKLGIGSFLTFEFGPMKRIDGHVQGERRLWIYLSNWLLLHGRRQIVSSDSERKAIAVALRRLQQTAFTDVQVDSRDFRTTFVFEDFRLVVSAADYIENADERDQYWLFFVPGEVLRVGPAGVTLERTAVAEHV